MADRLVQNLNVSPKKAAVSPTNGKLVQPKCTRCEEEEKIQKNEEPLVNGISHIQRKPIFESNGDLRKGELQAKMSLGSIVQAKCAACEEKEKLQRQDEEPEEEGNGIQAKTENSPSHAGANFQGRLQASKGDGHALNPDVQATMGAAFGTDFSNVRVHTGSNAVQMNKQIGAKAFTHGNHIYFNRGAYNTVNKSGKHLLAHELTHTIQQGASNKKWGYHRSRLHPTPNIQLSPFSDELQGIWDAGNKGRFYDRLRNIPLPNADHDVAVMVNTLRGDDHWLAINLLQHGSESQWPMHLKVEREMKGWSTSGGKAAVFDLLRAADRSIASNQNLTNTLSSVFSAGTDDLWLAQTIQANGPEPLWSNNLIAERHRRATSNNWPAEAGHIGASLMTSAGGNPVNAYFFPGMTDKRALIVGGVHGSELSGIEVVESLLDQLRTGPRPHFSVIVVPRLFPDNAAIAEARPTAIGNAANIGRNTCDTSQANCSGTNRGLPESGHAHDSANPRDANANVMEAENVALLELIERFKPTRIASIHAIRSTVDGGIYADPRTDSGGRALGYDTDRQLALEMARNASAAGANVPGNKLNRTNPNTVYPRDPIVVTRGNRQPRDTSAGHSLGGWGTTAICDPANPANSRSAMRVITVEVESSKRVQDMPSQSERDRRRREINAHVGALREIFLGPSVSDTAENPCLDLSAPQPPAP